MPRKTNKLNISAVITLSDGTEYPMAKEKKNHMVPCTTECTTEVGEKQRAKADDVYLKRPNEKNVLKKTSQEDAGKASRAFCNMRNLIQDAHAVAALLLLGLLALVMDLALPMLPGVPILQLGSLACVPEALRELMNVICGDEQWGRKGWRLKRPNCLEAVIPLGMSTPSTNPEDYIGGYVKIWDKKKYFWLPYRCTALVIAPNVPGSIVKKVINQSPLAMPILCGGNYKFPDRPMLKIDGINFWNYDPRILEECRKYSEVIRAQLEVFLQRLRDKKKIQRAWLSDIDSFRTKTHDGRFVQVNTSLDTEFYAAALSLWKQFLLFASEEAGWLTPKEAHETLLAYWRLVLPESAPNTNSGTWDDPQVFWEFLADFTIDAGPDIAPLGAVRMAKTQGVIHQLPDGVSYLIFPRQKLLEAYVTWLKRKNIEPPEQDSRWEPRTQGAMQDWGIQVKSAGRDTSWAWDFYSKGCAPAGEKERQNCLAFPLFQLPDTLKSVLKNRFGMEFESWCSPDNSQSIPKTKKDLGIDLN